MPKRAIAAARASRRVMNRWLARKTTNPRMRTPKPMAYSILIAHDRYWRSKVSWHSMQAKLPSGRPYAMRPYHRMFKYAVASLLLPIAAALSGEAMAQSWPPKTVHILVPFGPGSTPDIVARLVADGLSKKHPDSIF